MNTRFIKVGERIFAVEHIALVRRVSSGRVYLLTIADDDADPWEFDGQEAEALWAWASSVLNASDIVAFYEGADHV